METNGIIAMPETQTDKIGCARISGLEIYLRNVPVSSLLLKTPRLALTMNLLSKHQDKLSSSISYQGGVEVYCLGGRGYISPINTPCKGAAEVHGFFRHLYKPQTAQCSSIKPYSSNDIRIAISMIHGLYSLVKLYWAPFVGLNKKPQCPRKPNSNLPAAQPRRDEHRIVDGRTPAPL